ncbi:hypothetical protein L2E82_02074 [Cichorium intybus]|uniref:Uncharacterized protein n=1 Tax=Cichorium intybus TaxID=13427 RepID=A0ACB9H2S8_CICIN|nr:hypothetical protein L2E82_02074 [Cichorium intybus]
MRPSRFPTGCRRFSKLFNFLKLFLLRRSNMGYTKGLFSAITRDGEPIVKKLEPKTNSVSRDGSSRFKLRFLEGL